jgi:flagellar M-ring protein FliF
MKQLFKQLTGIWRELGIAQRITLGAGAIVVIGGMLALLFWAQRPQMRLLYGRLSEKDASEIVENLQAQKIPYEIGPGGTSIYVRADQVYKARMDLAAKGLPGGDGVGFEIFDRSNFGISDFVQRTNYTRAIQGELGRTISQLKGVRAARVMVVLPENRLLVKNSDSRATASVFVDTGGATLDSGAVNSIRSLVANAVEGLALDDVAVIDNRGNVLSDDLKSDPQLGGASSQIKYRRQVEDYLSTKVETMLGKVLGPGNAVVRVSADIDTQSGTVTEEKFDPDSQVSRSDVSTEDSTLTSEKSGEKPATVGVSANLPADNGGGATTASPSKSTEAVRRSKTLTYEINRSTTNVVKAPGTITRVTASVFLAAKAAAAGAAPTPRTPEELASLRLMVANALGIQATKPEELAKLVSVEETAFPAPPEVSPISTDKISGYAEMVRPLAGIAIAIGIFFIFLRLLKRTKPEEIKLEIVDDSSPIQQIAPTTKSHKISPELLNHLIRQKPEHVGATLRDWLATQEGR